METKQEMILVQQTNEILCLLQVRWKVNEVVVPNIQFWHGPQNQSKMMRLHQYEIRE